MRTFLVALCGGANFPFPPSFQFIPKQSRGTPTGTVRAARPEVGPTEAPRGAPGPRLCGGATAVDAAAAGGRGATQVGAQDGALSGEPAEAGDAAWMPNVRHCLKIGAMDGFEEDVFKLEVNNKMEGGRGSEVAIGVRRMYCCCSTAWRRTTHDKITQHNTTTLENATDIHRLYSAWSLVFLLLLLTCT